MPLRLIASPANGAILAWESDQTFQAVEVPGAVEYCWTVRSNGGEFVRCLSTRSYSHQARKLDPGSTTVVAEAFDANGERLAIQQIRVQLRVARVLRDPDEGEDIEVDRGFSVRWRNVETATNYCWNIRQGLFNSGLVCDPSLVTYVDSDYLHSVGVNPGDALFVGSAYRGNILVGRESINIEFEHDE